MSQLIVHPSVSVVQAARRIIENTFGILAARWRIFHGPIKAAVETVEAIVKATCILHNYLRLTDNDYYCPAGF